MTTTVTRLLALAAVLILTLSACGKEDGGGDDGGATSAAATTIELSGWDEFVEREDLPATRQVVFIGVDGASWDYMDELLAKGRLPNVARIRKEGAYATLRSVQSYVSPPAWTALLTGYLPEKSGVYTFGAYDRQEKTFGGIRSTDALVPFVWEAAGRAGLKSAVINVPMTYPVYPINGIMVSGLLTPIDVGGSIALRPSTRADADAIFRRAREDAKTIGTGDASPPSGSLAEDELNVFAMLLHDTKDDGKPGYDTVSLHVYAKDAEGNPSGEPHFSTFDLEHYSPWVPIRVRAGTEHKAAYTRIKLELDGSSPSIATPETVFPITAEYTYPDTLADELVEHFGLYLPTKMMTREIVPTLARDNAEYASFFYDYDDWDLFCFVFTQSDNVHHKSGFDDNAEAVYTEIDRFLGEMMTRMPGDAVLIVGSDHGNSSYDYGIELNVVFEEMGLLERDGSDIDHERTLVFHNLWHLYFNRELVTRGELEARGFDVPASVDPLDFLRRVVIEACAAIEVDGRAYPVQVEPVSAQAAGEAPDMIVTGTYDDYRVEYWALQHPRYEKVYELTGVARHWHSRDGVFLMWGDGVKEGYDAGTVGIEDVAPTISYFLGLPVGDDMDGRALTEALRGDLLAGRPAFVTRNYRDIPREGPAVTEGREELEKKLRSLGYIK